MKTIPPHQPKGGRPWKIDIPEKVEGLGQVSSYVRDSTRCISMSLRNKYTLFDSRKTPLLL